MIGVCRTNYIKKMFFLVIILPVIGIIDFRRDFLGFPDLSWISRSLDCFYLVNTCALFFYVFYRSFQRKFFLSKIAILIIFLYVYIFFRSFLVDHDLDRPVVNVLIMIPILELSIRTERDFSSFTDVLNFFSFVNFVSILALYSSKGLKYWSDITEQYWVCNYFLGYDNGFIILILPLLCFNLILYNSSRKKRYLLYITICILTEVLVFSASSLIAIVIFFILYFWGKHSYIKRIIYNPLINIVWCFVVFYILVMCRFLDWINNIAFLFFHKSLSAARSGLWEAGLDRIRQKLMFGYGFGRVELKGGYNAPHQMILEWLLQGGIIELGLYVIILFLVFSNLNSKLQFRNVLIIFNGIISFLVAYIAESYSTYPYYWVFLSLFIFANKKFILENKISICRM